MDSFDSPEGIVKAKHPDIPVLCYRPKSLENAAHWFIKHMPGRTLYAVKANPAPYVLSSLYASGIKDFDAASIAEIKLVRDYCPGAFVAFMNPVKSRSAIVEAYFDHHVRHFAFDSAEELEKIITSVGDISDLGLVLRLAVPNTSSAMPLAGKFGALPEEAINLLKAARKVSSQLGISFHVGSQTMEPKSYGIALAVVGQVIKAAGVKIDFIDVGGGFPSIYPGMLPPTLCEYKNAIIRGFEKLTRRYGPMELWSEPGRALVAESASLLVKVELRKGNALYINDGTYGALFDAGGHMGFRYPVRLVRPAGMAASPALQDFHFYGPTCDSIDHMPGPFSLPVDVQEGDYIEIGQLGAYGSVMRTDFNGFYTFETAAVATPPLMSLYKKIKTPEPVQPLGEVK